MNKKGSLLVLAVVLVAAFIVGFSSRDFSSSFLAATKTPAKPDLTVGIPTIVGGYQPGHPITFTGSVYNNGANLVATSSTYSLQIFLGRKQRWDNNP